LESIVCGVDFSKAAQAALKAADELARVNGSRLTVVFVDDPLLVAAAKAAHDSRGGPAAAQTALKRFVDQSLCADQSLREEPSARCIETVTAAGEPAAELLKAARRSDADLIVLGTHGSGRGTRLLFGSTLTRLLHKTRLPVLVVPS
jgi:nucleotide-binding universal stress UspA family protein